MRNRNDDSDGNRCWSNYMGRMPQLPSEMVTVPKPEVFPNEDSDNWVPYTDEGAIDNAQPSRIRAISLQISILCEISNDILLVFYNPTPATSSPAAKPLNKTSISSEFKKLGQLFSRLEKWKKNLPLELEARGGSLPSTLLMHMFHQTLYIHLFRPFLKFSAQHHGNTTSPLSHLDPRKACLAAATTISKYLRFYKHRYKLRQICNIAGYFIHSACTIHLLNLPQKTAARDIIQGLQGLEDMGECWLVARRSLVIIDILVRRWRLDIPDEASVILARSRGEAKRWGLQEKALRGGSPASSARSEAGSAIAVPDYAARASMSPRIALIQQQQGLPQMQFSFSHPVPGIYAAAGPQAGVPLETSLGYQQSTDAWLLRDQEDLGAGLAGLGELGWEGGDVTGANWAPLANTGWSDCNWGAGGVM